MRNISQDGLKFIEKWEELVLYVYDDKVGKRRINGKMQYPEWEGDEPIGTLTIGYGHTDAAGYPKIRQGMRVTEEQANEILATDLRGCISDVSKVKLPLTQHETDTLISFDFNCGAGNLNRLLKGATEDNYKTFVPKRLMQFVTSKGERMQGLVNRRAGEVKMWGTWDEEGAEEELANPKGERDAPPKPMATSKTGGASILAGTGGATVALTGFNEATDSLKHTKENFHDLGIMDFVGQALHFPLFWVGVGILVIGGFIYWDRYKKLTEDHV